MKIDDNKIFMDQFKLLTNNNTIKKCLGEDITLFYSKTDKPIEKFVKQHHNLVLSFNLKKGWFWKGIA